MTYKNVFVLMDVRFLACLWKKSFCNNPIGKWVSSSLLSCSCSFFKYQNSNSTIEF